MQSVELKKSYPFRIGHQALYFLITSLYLLLYSNSLAQAAEKTGFIGTLLRESKLSGNEMEVVLIEAIVPNSASKEIVLTIHSERNITNNIKVVRSRDTVPKIYFNGRLDKELKVTINSPQNNRNGSADLTAKLVKDKITHDFTLQVSPRKLRVSLTSRKETLGIIEKIQISAERVNDIVIFTEMTKRRQSTKRYDYVQSENQNIDDPSRNIKTLRLAQQFGKDFFIIDNSYINENAIVAIKPSGPGEAMAFRGTVNLETNATFAFLNKPIGKAKFRSTNPFFYNFHDLISLNFSPRKNYHSLFPMNITKGNRKITVSTSKNDSQTLVEVDSANYTFIKAIEKILPDFPTTGKTKFEFWRGLGVKTDKNGKLSPFNIAVIRATSKQHISLIIDLDSEISLLSFEKSKNPAALIHPSDIRGKAQVQNNNSITVLGANLFSTKLFKAKLEFQERDLNIKIASLNKDKALETSIEGLIFRVPNSTITKYASKYQLGALKRKYSYKGSYAATQFTKEKTTKAIEPLKTSVSSKLEINANTQNSMHIKFVSKKIKDIFIVYDPESTTFQLEFSKDSNSKEMCDADVESRGIIPSFNPRSPRINVTAKCLTIIEDPPGERKRIVQIEITEKIFSLKSLAYLRKAPNLRSGTRMGPFVKTSTTKAIFKRD